MLYWKETFLGAQRDGGRDLRAKGDYDETT